MKFGWVLNMPLRPPYTSHWQREDSNKYFKEIINYFSFLVFPIFFQNFFPFLPNIIVVQKIVPKTLFFMPEFNESLSF